MKAYFFAAGRCASSLVNAPLGVVLASALLLAACAAPPTRPVPPDVEAAWQSHRAALARVTRWHLSASLGVRAGRDGGQANMDWRQQQDGSYDIRLSGPVGSGAARLSGDPQGATLRMGNGDHWSSPDPAQLLLDQFGWWIPVDSLRYWAVGLPDPSMPAHWSLDDYGRLASLSQNGWEVRFEAYEQAGTLDLPERLTVTGEDAEVRMVARRWTIDLAEAK